jgi:raffinose/stachyose/melibiose transport system permease protein
MKNNKVISIGNSFYPYAYVGPALIFFLLFMLYPIIFSLALSFFDWNGFNADIFGKFVEFKNYIKVFNDSFFWIAFRNTLIFVFAGITIQLAIALILAIIIFYSNLKYSSIVRAIIFFPGILSSVIVGLVWKRFFVMDGLVNQIFGALKLDFLVIPWLSNLYLPIWIVTFVSIWQWTGYNLVIFYAALQSFDNELIEASMIDGANARQTISHVIIPVLKPIIGLSVVLNFIGGFRVFDLVYVLTKGGPNHVSEVLTTIMYYYAFDPSGPNRMGYASSIAVVLLVIIIIFSIFRIRLMRKS